MTAMIQQEKRLEEYHNNLMDMTACGIISYTLPERDILYMNTEALRIYGAEDMEGAKEQMTQLLQKTSYPDPDTTRRLVRLRDEEGSVDYECDILNAKGYKTRLLARTEVYRTLEDKRAVFTTFWDISENMTLKNEKNILDALCIDYVSVYQCDLELDSMRLLKCHMTPEREKAAEELGKDRYCYSSRVRYFADHFLVKESAPDFLEKMSAAYMREYLVAHDRFVYRFQIKLLDEGHCYYEAQAVKLVQSEGYKIVLGFRYVDDIVREEERQKRELELAAARAEKASAAKTEFLRRMSHDIRTPLNGIMGMLGMAQEHMEDTEMAQEYMGKALAASRQLMMLVNDVLDIGKLEADGFVVKDEPFDIRKVVADQITAAEAYAARYHVTVQGGPDTMDIKDPYVVGSASLLNRVLMNVSSNAVKYNRPGGRITLSCTQLQTGAQTSVFQFVCEDTGIGMSEEFLKHAFEPYAQEGQYTNTSYSGTGLGLSIVQKIVMQMGGTIDLQSCKGKGTRVVLQIPFQLDLDRQEAEAEPAAGLEETVSFDLSGKRALLVEDNELNLEIAEAMLEELHVQTAVALNGKEAVDLFEASAPDTFDFVLMDIMMPVMDGLEAARQIRGLKRQDAGKVPILALSANAFEDDVQRSLAAGMNAHLTKPLELQKMIRELQAVW